MIEARPGLWPERDTGRVQDEQNRRRQSNDDKQEQDQDPGGT